MRTPLFLAALLAAAPPLLGATVSFDNDVAGQPPNGWTCGRTGNGTPRWTVEADGTAPSRPNVLRQAGEATFSWCVRDGTDTGTGQIEVKFKPISGKEDQAGGLVWRWKDGNNYYVARANALENNVALYYTVDGSRKTIKYADAPVTVNTWHKLRVTYKDDAIQVSLDGKTYIEVNDAHIAGTGKAGVWTKADSVTLFDDFNAVAP